MNGIDYSLWRPPSSGWLLAQGYGFVCRYLSYGLNPKVIGAAEYMALKAAGLEVVLVFEYGAQDMLGGWAAGAGDAKAALQQAQALGAWPCPIYFAADWSVDVTQESDVLAYLKACAFVLGGVERVGVYGGIVAVSAALDAGACRYAWQTYAWSAGVWDERAQLRQVPGGTPDYDLDTSLAEDFGQVPRVWPEVTRRVVAAEAG